MPSPEMKPLEVKVFSYVSNGISRVANHSHIKGIFRVMVYYVAAVNYSSGGTKSKHQADISSLEIAFSGCLVQ